MSKLAELRKKLQEAEARRNGASNGTSGGEGETYPFWNIPVDSTAKVRFLPDANPDNTFFWSEKQMIKLPFPGIKGGDEHKEVIVQVPCMEMYGKSCPVLTEVRPWWNEDSMKEMASKYWKKRSFIFQGFVQEDPISGDKPENPIRKFVIGPQIFNIIKGSLLDPDFENIPTDYINGTDFSITKSSKGQYADYSTSKWGRRESALTEEQLAAVEANGLKDLSTFLPREPSAEEISVIFEMFEASVNGELYDPAKWAQFYKPYGLDYNGPSAARTTPASTPAASTPAATESHATTTPAASAPAESAPAVTETASAPAETAESGSANANDILAMIRNRNAG